MSDWHADASDQSRTHTGGTSGSHSTRSIHLLGVDLGARWASATPELQALARGLHAELGALTQGAALPLPDRKARLTRRGGRCERDGTPLTFAPWTPDTHVCPTCHVVYRGTEHDDWWALGAQLWSAERTLHAAVLGVMWNDPSLLELAQRALDRFSDRWDTYPNRDNVLGPSRLFFSTYLESVWLLNTTLAAHVLRGYGERTEADMHVGSPNQPLISRESALNTVNRFVTRVVEPDRALIASYPEGLSNRQTWHTAALLSSASLLRDEAAIAPLVDGALGVSTLVNRGLLSDGTWYEGENYHLFAHRGLWYGVTLLESLGASLSHDTNERYATGFCTPFLGVLPDGTFPSRRDSRYAVSVQQWRFAEWCELGLQRRNDELLRVWLHRLYSAPLSEERSVAYPGQTRADADTGRSRSTADIERDEPALQLRRQDLGWRTLLFARNEPWAEAVSAGEGSIALPAQGLHVLRRDRDRIYVALEGGHTGGGHGHPDRLALTIQDGSSRVLEDPGTGSYTERTLHWYRSTLAHNAPLINGLSQRPVEAQLVAFEARSGVAWTRVRVPELAPGVRVQRSAVLFDEHVVDVVEWTSQTATLIDLPVHVEGDTADMRSWHPGQPFNMGGLEDGIEFVRDAECTPLAAGELVCVVRQPSAGPAQQAAGARQSDWHAAQPLQASESTVRCWYALSGGGELWRANAPGPPGCGDRRLYWLRARGEAGVMLGVWSLRNSVESVQLASAASAACPASPASLASLASPTPAESPADQSPSLQVVMRNGTSALHVPEALGWHIDLQAGNARSRIDLQALNDPIHLLDAPERTVQRPSPGVAPVHVRLDEHLTVHFPLGKAHYRRSEQSWDEAGSPTADVQLTYDGPHLRITVQAQTGAVVVPEPDAINALDNERADVNADGLQLYVAPADSTQWTGAWLVVPDVSGPRVTALVAANDDATSEPGLEVQSEHTNSGWTMHIALRCAQHGLQPGQPLRFDLIVNERPPDRERRRGQLVLSGARDEFVYLRGDRHDILRSWVLLCVPSHLSRSLSQPLV